MQSIKCIVFIALTMIMCAWSGLSVMTRFFLAMESKSNASRSRLFEDLYPLIHSYYGLILDPFECTVHHSQLRPSLDHYFGLLRMTSNLEIEFLYRRRVSGRQTIVIGPRGLSHYNYGSSWQMEFGAGYVLFRCFGQNVRVFYMNTTIEIGTLHHFYVKDAGGTLTLRIDGETFGARRQDPENWATRRFPDPDVCVSMNARNLNLSEQTARFAPNLHFFSIKLSGTVLTPRPTNQPTSGPTFWTGSSCADYVNTGKTSTTRQ